MRIIRNQIRITTYFVFAVLNEVSESSRTSNVTPFTNVNESDFRSKDQRLKTRDGQSGVSLRDLTRLEFFHDFGNGLNMTRGSTAATTNHINKTIGTKVLD